MTGCPEAGRVAAAITSHRYTYRDEDQLQEAIARMLAGLGWEVEREVRLTPRDRVDLLVDRVGVEVKIAGTAESAARQLQRYAGSDLVDGLVLATTRRAHRSVPGVLGGKPVTVAVIGGLG